MAFTAWCCEFLLNLRVWGSIYNSAPVSILSRLWEWDRTVVVLYGLVLNLIRYQPEKCLQDQSNLLCALQVTWAINNTSSLMFLNSEARQQELKRSIFTTLILNTRGEILRLMFTLPPTPPFVLFCGSVSIKLGLRDLSSALGLVMKLTGWSLANY